MVMLSKWFYFATLEVDIKDFVLTSGVYLGNTTHGYKLRANVSSSNDYGFILSMLDNGVDLYRVTSSTGVLIQILIDFICRYERVRITSGGYVGINETNRFILSVGINTSRWDLVIKIDLTQQIMTLLD